MWPRKRKPDPSETIRTLREHAFTVSANDLGMSLVAGDGVVWAVLMETGYAEAVASLVTIADGTTSLYFSNGGGIIGAGQHASVRTAADAFIAATNMNVDQLAPTADHPLPGVGRVRFYARTFDGLLSAEVPENDLGENRHALSPLFYAGQAVITAVREASPQG